ncbi:MAG: DNA glycosylase [Clostridia bacterium]|nr:DNA glycosylase [Clostridia bacterium]
MLTTAMPAVTQSGKDLIIDAKGYDLALTLDCGQCFRFEPSGENTFEGVAFGRYIQLRQTEQDRIILLDTDICDAELWLNFLGLNLDWEAIKSDVSSRSDVLSDAASLAGGIRILKQDEFEAIISFVISQCNNIPRIKGLISALSQKFGSEIVSPSGKEFYSFPTADALANAPLSELRALKLGYRAEYVQNAAIAVKSGLIEEIKAEKSTEKAIKILRSVEGIGEKVAACALLFGFGRLDAFPRDVWIKKAMAKYFPDCKDLSVFGPYAGVAQQYLFYRERYIGE